ncbi:hypothetical protein NSK_003276 [Nannochloropsis salina CCMP1776]|uniref:Gamma carbonic anhydrase n=1 Tax=Nannochloropsis salina CCMP1776 TaxID=1027361 RepID=A0A4D9D2I8_9STRA|nr:hypothetical protein NSK_003276 [Nannochloropsis salina CCMP1776]|eukprot:TFJ85772.1 hypothetical protein NSK_003276 [Nannochloropsis salina CCMP1776]
MSRLIRKGLDTLGKALRETGQALDRTGMEALGSDKHKELWSRHRQVSNLFDQRPRVASNAFVSPSATVIGEVSLWDKVSIWYGAVIRGDRNSVKIGNCTNVQDHAVICTVPSLDSGFPATVDIGNLVTIGHSATITSATIEDKALVGIGSIVSEGALVETGAQLAAGSVVPPGGRIPAGELWGGNPVKFIRKLEDEEVLANVAAAEAYHALAQSHENEFLPFGAAYLDAEKVKVSK